MIRLLKELFGRKQGTAMQDHPVDKILKAMQDSWPERFEVLKLEYLVSSTIKYKSTASSKVARIRDTMTSEVYVFEYVSEFNGVDRAYTYTTTSPLAFTENESMVLAEGAFEQLKIHGWDTTEARQKKEAAALKVETARLKERDRLNKVYGE